MLTTLLSVALDPNTSVKLEFWPDLGTKIGYERRMEWRAEDFSYEQVDRIEGRVSQRDSRGEVTIEWVLTPVRAAMDGAEIRALTTKAIAYKERRLRNGTLAHLDDWPQDSFGWLRYAGLTSLFYPSEPVKPGSTWQMEWMEERSSGLPPFAINMRFQDWVDPDENTLARFTVGVEEKNRADAMRGHGRGVVDVKTGFYRELTLTIESATVPGDEEQQRGKLTISLQPIPSPAR